MTLPAAQRYAMIRTAAVGAYGDLRIEARRESMLVSDRRIRSMVAGHLNYGIPDIDLPLGCGGTVNPTSFAGHQLVVLFLPVDATQRAAEFASYNGLSNELSHTDAWFVVVASEPFSPADAKTRVALDPDARAWRAFKENAADATLDRKGGAAFFFTRGGALHRIWAGPGHAREVAEELLARG
jgi:hypothetical protein